MRLFSFFAFNDYFIVTNRCFAKMNDVASEGFQALDVDHSRDLEFLNTHIFFT